MTHPLTDDIIESELATPTHFISGSLVGLFTHDDIRAATDWQLEQVLKFMEEDGFGPRRISLLKNAMRPQKDTP